MELEDRSASDVFSNHLAWLLERDPTGLGTDQRKIRARLADIAQFKEQPKDCPPEP